MVITAMDRDRGGVALHRVVVFLDVLIIYIFLLYAYMTCSLTHPIDVLRWQNVSRPCSATGFGSGRLSNGHRTNGPIILSVGLVFRARTSDLEIRLYFDVPKVPRNPHVGRRIADTHLAGFTWPSSSPQCCRRGIPTRV